MVRELLADIPDASVRQAAERLIRTHLIQDDLYARTKRASQDVREISDEIAALKEHDPAAAENPDLLDELQRRRDAWSEAANVSSTVKSRYWSQYCQAAGDGVPMREVVERYKHLAKVAIHRLSQAEGSTSVSVTELVKDLVKDQ